jgi:replication factor C subunit 2/4
MGSLTAHVLFLRGVSSMTSAAQQALRRTMEIYSNTTRFALACNVSSKIIEPIQSRCAILRYTRLGDEQVLKRLLEVIKAEGVRHGLCPMLPVTLISHLFSFSQNIPHTDDGLEAVLFTAEGDMRQALNNLQSTHAGYGFVNRENVFKVRFPLLLLCHLAHHAQTG